MGASVALTCGSGCWQGGVRRPRPRVPTRRRRGRQRPRAPSDQRREPPPGRLQRLRVARLQHRLQVEDPAPNASSVREPTTAKHGTPAWRARVATSPVALPASVPRSSRPSPMTTRARGAHARVEVELLQHERRAGLQRARRTPPTARRRARRRRRVRDAARVARRAASRAPRSRAPSARRVARPRPRRPSASATRSTDVRTSHSTTSRARRPPPRRDRLHRARAAVAPRRVRRRRRGSPARRSRRPPQQLAGRCARRRPASRRCQSAERWRAARRAPCRRPRPGRSRPTARRRVDRRRLAAERGQQHLQRALAAVGDRARVDRPAAPPRARARAPRRPRRPQRPAEGGGRDEDRRARRWIARHLPQPSRARRGGGCVDVARRCLRPFHGHGARAHDARGGRARGAAVEPGQDLLPAAGLTKHDLVDYYLAVADAALVAPARAPDGDEALRRRDRRRAVLAEARAETTPDVAARRRRSRSRPAARRASCARRTPPTSCGRSTSA